MLFARFQCLVFLISVDLGTFLRKTHGRLTTLSVCIWLPRSSQVSDYFHPQTLQSYGSTLPLLYKFIYFSDCQYSNLAPASAILILVRRVRVLRTKSPHHDRQSDRSSMPVPTDGWDVLPGEDDIIFAGEISEGRDDGTYVPEGDLTATASSLSPSTLSDSQEKVLSVLLCFSALLSIAGSSSIVYKIIRNRRYSKPYHRTMLALSSSDVLASITCALFSFLMPKGQRIWSFGNQATCSILGFLTQLTFMAAGCNCILSFYYLLTIRFGVNKRQQFAQRFEKPMHAINLSFFLITATVGVIKGFYSPIDVGFGCWVNDWPKGCDQTGGCLSQRIGIIYAGIPILFSFVSILINNVMIYRYVSSIFKSLDRGTTQGMTAKEAIAARKLRNLDDNKIKEVATQGFLYVGSFLFCYIPATVLRLIEAFTYNYDDSSIYWLLLITAITLPLQGFFNMFIYNRSYYVRIRAENPGLTWLQAIRSALLDSKTFSTEESERSNSANNSGFAPRIIPRQKNSRNKSSKFSSTLDAVLEERSQAERSEHSSDDCKASSQMRQTKPLWV
jgi:hypothetical protein